MAALTGTLRIQPSAMRRGSIHTVTITSLRDIVTNVAQTSADTTVKVAVTNAAGTTTLAETAMTYVGSGEWTSDIPASAFEAGADPWTVTVTAYNQAGSTVRATFRHAGRDVPVLAL